MNPTIQTTNWRGDKFADFYPAKDPSTGPGWYVFGRNCERYGAHKDGKGAYIMLCARPDVAPRNHPHYNIKVRRGWHTRREAQAVADGLNASP